CDFCNQFSFRHFLSSSKLDENRLLLRPLSNSMLHPKLKHISTDSQFDSLPGQVLIEFGSIRNNPSSWERCKPNRIFESYSARKNFLNNPKSCKTIRFPYRPNN